ncbi:MAG: hypothetical protein EPN97_12495 [Alphaproteobacteria bacterium]|nr:MAG: hypothetical protein EPN97_12495 [Alphaproteobacteria bacterium]
MKETRLYDIVDKISGDSWNGTHDRSIHVTYVDADHITVENEYNGSGPRGVFTLIEIVDAIENEDFRKARYFSDFCYELGQHVPNARVVESEHKWYYSGVLLPATPKMVDREMAAGAGDNVTALKPLTLMPKAENSSQNAPKPFVLRLKMKT